MPFKFIFLSASIIFVLVVGVFWVYPEYMKISNSENGKAQLLEKRKMELEKSRQMKENGVQLVDQLKERRSDIDRLLEIFPRLSEEEKAIVFIDNSVRVSGTSLIDLKIKEEAKVVAEEKPTPASFSSGNLVDGAGNSVTKAPALVEKEEIKTRVITLTFAVSGSYEGFKKFVEELEKSPRKGEITKLGIVKKVEEKGKEKQTSFVMTGEVSFAYAPLKTIKPGIIPSVFSESSLDFSPLKKFPRENGYASSEMLPASRANPFVL